MCFIIKCRWHEDLLQFIDRFSLIPTRSKGRSQWAFSPAEKSLYVVCSTLQLCEQGREGQSLAEMTEMWNCRTMRIFLSYEVSLAFCTLGARSSEFPMPETIFCSTAWISLPMSFSASRARESANVPSWVLGHPSGRSVEGTIVENRKATARLLI
jgi:hypothetical protein